VNLPNQGNGIDQFKAVIMQWICDEIGRASQGGIGLHLDGATGNLVIDNGDVRSGNFVAGTSGWDLKPTGDQELHGNTVIGGSTSIAGTLAVGAATTIGGTLGVTGVTNLGAATVVSGPLNVTGPMTVGGTLSLPAGIIDNAALASPVQHGSSGSSGSGFAVNTTHTLRGAGSITVPAGFSQATIMCVVDATAINGVTTGGGYLQVQASIAGSPGGTGTSLAAYGYQAGASASAIRTITGLSGGTIAVGAFVYATADFGTNALNLADVNAIAIFTR
jgi:hypothetical protein